MNRKGLGFKEIIYMAIGVAILIILFGILTKTYADWKLVKEDCKGVCRASTVCDAGETKTSETCYVGGKKQEGQICCLSLDALQGTKNSTAGNGVNTSSNTNNNSNSNSNSNSGGNPPTTGTSKTILEVRKGQDEITKIKDGSTQTLDADLTYTYKIWATGKDPLYCTIKMLNASNSEPTQIEGLKVDIAQQKCSDSAGTNTDQQVITLDPTFISGEQNTYKLNMLVYNSTGGQEASSIITFIVRPSGTVTT